MSLKQKTVSGLLWSTIDTFVGQGLAFVVGVILARLLSPKEFGLIGMTAIFIAVSESFVNSGFSSALIRKKGCSQIDYSTVFFFNLVVGVILYVVLYFSAPSIAVFFREPLLKPILRVLGFVIIIDSFTIIQRTILTKRIDFKLQTKISIIASIGSGILSIIMAINGYGVWSLVVQIISKQGLNSLFLWIWNKWKPSRVFSKTSFNELFGFGSNIMLNSLLDTLFNNSYYFVIGKFYSAYELGFFTRANQFKDIFSLNLNGIIGRVSYPVLSSIQDDNQRLKVNYRIIIRSTMFVTFIAMLGMAAIAEPLIITLIGEKWRQSIVYLQMLCFVGMLYPLHALNLNMLQVQGRSDLFLKLGIIKKLFIVPVIIIGIFWGVKIMIIGMIVNTLIAYYLNSYYSGRMINYPVKEQLIDILPSFGLAISMAISVYVFGSLLSFMPVWRLVLQILFGSLFIIIFCEATRFRDYILIRELISDKFKKNNGNEAKSTTEFKY